MTGILVLVALVVAAAIGAWLVTRSSDEPADTSGVDPEATGGEPREPRER